MDLHDAFVQWGHRPPSSQSVTSCLWGSICRWLRRTFIALGHYPELASGHRLPLGWLSGICGPRCSGTIIGLFISLSLAVTILVCGLLYAACTCWQTIMCLGFSLVSIWRAGVGGLEPVRTLLLFCVVVSLKERPVVLSLPVSAGLAHKQVWCRWARARQKLRIYLAQDHVVNFHVLECIFLLSS